MGAAKGSETAGEAKLVAGAAAAGAAKGSIPIPMPMPMPMPIPAPAPGAGAAAWGAGELIDNPPRSSSMSSLGFCVGGGGGGAAAAGAGAALAPASPPPSAAAPLAYSSIVCKKLAGGFSICGNLVSRNWLQLLAVR